MGRVAGLFKGIICQHVRIRVASVLLLLRVMMVFSLSARPAMNISVFMRNEAGLIELPMVEPRSLFFSLQCRWLEALQPRDRLQNTYRDLERARRMR